jgi:hypothetical protein
VEIERKRKVAYTGCQKRKLNETSKNVKLPWVQSQANPEILFHHLYVKTHILLLIV